MTKQYFRSKFAIPTCSHHFTRHTVFKRIGKYVRSEFEAYLKCGRLEYGFLRVRCEDCQHEHLVAFSWPLLRIHAPAAFVHPARHHAEGFSRGLPDPAVVRGNGRKRRLAG